MNAIPQAAIAGLGLAALISLITPVIIYLICRTRMELPLRNIAVGAGMFFLSALVLEAAMHFYFLRANPATSAWLMSHTWGFVLYAVSAAAIFEETARLIAFRLFIRRTGDAGTAVSYGIGHGGAESIIVGALAQVQMMAFAFLLNTGKFAATLGGKMPPSAIAKLRVSLIHLDFFTALTGSVERICAVLLQIALSLLVWRAVERKDWRWFVAALLLHAGVDSSAALYQRGALPLAVVEGIVFAVGLALLIFFVAGLPPRRTLSPSV